MYCERVCGSKKKGRKLSNLCDIVFHYLCLFFLIKRDNLNHVIMFFIICVFFFRSERLTEALQAYLGHKSGFQTNSRIWIQNLQFLVWTRSRSPSFTIWPPARDSLFVSLHSISSNTKTKRVRSFKWIGILTGCSFLLLRKYLISCFPLFVGKKFLTLEESKTKTPPRKMAEARGEIL